MASFAEMECPVCAEIYGPKVIPKFLISCGHTICAGCIERLQRSGKMNCPNCRTAISISGKFQTNYALLTLVEVSKEICARREELVGQVDNYKQLLDSINFDETKSHEGKFVSSGGPTEVSGLPAYHRRWAAVDVDSCQNRIQELLVQVDNYSQLLESSLDENKSLETKCEALILQNSEKLAELDVYRKEVNSMQLKVNQSDSLVQKLSLKSELLGEEISDIARLLYEETHPDLYTLKSELLMEEVSDIAQLLFEESHQNILLRKRINDLKRVNEKLVSEKESILEGGKLANTEEVRQ